MDRPGRTSRGRPALIRELRLEAVPRKGKRHESATCVRIVRERGAIPAMVLKGRAARGWPRSRPGRRTWAEPTSRGRSRSIPRSRRRVGQDEAQKPADRQLVAARPRMALAAAQAAQYGVGLQVDRRAGQEEAAESYRGSRAGELSGGGVGARAPSQSPWIEPLIRSQNPEDDDRKRHRMGSARQPEADRPARDSRSARERARRGGVQYRFAAQLSASARATTSSAGASISIQPSRAETPV